jgi:NADPH:quinone reductase-like Zn-dependent oxidoreductase
MSDSIFYTKHYGILIIPGKMTAAYPAGCILCTRSTDTTGRAIFNRACEALLGDILNRCARLISEGKPAVRVSVSLPLEEAARAHG